MRFRNALALVLTAVAFFLLPLSARGQQTDTPPKLALQVFAGKQAAGSYISLDAPGTNWFNPDPRIPSWKEPEGALPIKAVRFAHHQGGERVQVRVTIHRGVKFYDVEEFVAEYTARVGELYVVDGLKNFGIQPFRFRVVRQEKLPAREIGVGNLTYSVEVVSAMASDEKRLSVKLVLRNNSPRKVMALKLKTVRDGHDTTIGSPLGRDGKALIEPGGTYETYLPVSGAGTEMEGSYVPQVPETVVISSALFAGGDYEGEVGPAANAAANYAGYRIGLVRILELIDRALDSAGGDEPQAIVELKKKIEELDREIDPAAVEALASAYPGLNEGERKGIEGAAEVPLSWLRQEMLGRLTALEKGPYKVRPDFREWLKERRRHLESWLTRLRAAELPGPR